MDFDGKRGTKNTPKGFIIGHLGNAMMVHQHGQCRLWPSSHLKAALHLSHQRVSHKRVAPHCGKRRKLESHRQQVRTERWRIDTTPEKRRNKTARYRHVETINALMEPTHTVSSCQKFALWSAPEIQYRGAQYSIPLTPGRSEENTPHKAIPPRQ
jgi:hypothetical protein